jgi:protein tyrosine phosphatase (PTP) superfamily phosphohydrolase (DUF442 family)
MEYSEITNQLLIGTTPDQRDFELLRGMGVDLVINMRLLRGRSPRDGSASIRYLRLRSFDNPLMPIQMDKLMRGTRAALKVLERGGKVYVHCSKGRHRSVAMAAAILIAQGLQPEEAMRLIQERGRRADPQARHIRSRILKFERRWARRGSRGVTAGMGD